MASDLKTSISVNNSPVDLNEFAHTYITRIVLCAVSMLKGGQDVKSLSYDLSGDKVSLIINNADIPLSPFPRAALIGTFSGMVSSLRGIDKIERLQIEMKISE